MNLSALFLFGSRARGDHSQNSDIDLLAVTDVSEFSVSGSETASLYQYSHAWLASRASKGDLFAWHLVSEAQAVFDPNDFLDHLRGKFRFAESYEEQIEKASDVGWLIASMGTELDAKLANRWLAWSVRTISIAHAAQMRTPAFAAQALASALKQPDIGFLVEQKNQLELSRLSLVKLTKFLTEFGNAETLTGPLSIDEYMCHFRTTENDVGFKILGSKSKATGYA